VYNDFKNPAINYEFIGFKTKTPQARLDFRLSKCASGCRGQANSAIYECNIWLHDKSVKAQQFKCRDLLQSTIETCDTPRGDGADPYACLDAHEDRSMTDAVSLSKATLTSAEEASCRVCGIVRYFVQHGIDHKDGFSPHYIKPVKKEKSQKWKLSKHVSEMGEKQLKDEYRAKVSQHKRKNKSPDDDDYADDVQVKKTTMSEASTYDVYPSSSSATLKHAAFLGVAPNVAEEDVQLEMNMFPVCEPLSTCHPKCKRAVQRTMVACTKWMYAQHAADRTKIDGSGSSSAKYDIARATRAKCETLTDVKFGDEFCDDERDSRENCFESVAVGFRVLLKKNI